MAFAPFPEPDSPLGKHRPLAPSAGVRVSPLCLGAMNFGNAWKDFMGVCDKKTAFEMLDFFYENGGNFIDTANNYQNEESEEWIGEWMEQRGVRDQMVIATKYTTDFKAGKRSEHSIHANYTGNSHKSMHVSLEASLKKLRTDYVDVLYLHWWDLTCPVEEVMQALNRMVQVGKVLYLGVSDTPAYIVTRANQYARDHGLKQFCVYQGQWSAAKRDLEAEILPMCELEGMAIAPWGALGGGNFKTEEERKQPGRNTPAFGVSEADAKVSKVLEKIGKNHGNVHMTSIALAYVMHAAPDVYPIVGGRTIKHIKGNIEALKIRLSEEELQEIEQAYGYTFPFPWSMIQGTQKNAHRRLTPADNFLTRSAMFIETPARRQPVLPSGPNAK
ncbi:MAG: hypothetical protein M1821_003174 [Bathelium mastoideum]|nr:MAG: hypothetical protein M1821_003174 [Bathelium mastoideum]